MGTDAHPEMYSLRVRLLRGEIKKFTRSEVEEDAPSPALRVIKIANYHEQESRFCRIRDSTAGSPGATAFCAVQSGDAKGPSIPVAILPIRHGGNRSAPVG